MRQFISEMIERFGGRQAGSAAEERAQDFLQERLKNVAHVERHRFTEHLTAHFSSLKIFCWLYYLSLAAFDFSLYVSFIIAAINAVLFHGHFVSYRSWLDFLFKKHSSSNVIATIEPRKKATSTLIFTAHIDSTPEFIWWYRLKNFGGFLTFIAGFAFTFWPFMLLAQMSMNMNTETVRALYLVFSALAIPTLAFYFIHGKYTVAGAMDNLSGIAIITALAESLVTKTGKSNKPVLQQTRVRVISFGSEEPGLKGSRAFVNDYRDTLRNENAVIVNIDGIMKEEKLRIIFHEVNPAVTYPSWLVERLQAAFEENQLPPSRGIIAVGGTDAASFALEKIPAACIVGQTLYKLDPEYHTLLDLPEAVDEKALESVLAILQSFAKNWDKSPPGSFDY